MELNIGTEYRCNCIGHKDTLNRVGVLDRGDNNASQDFYGRTKDLRVYDKALTDE